MSSATGACAWQLHAKEQKEGIVSIGNVHSAQYLSLILHSDSSVLTDNQGSTASSVTPNTQKMILLTLQCYSIVQVLKTEHIMNNNNVRVREYCRTSRILSLGLAFFSRDYRDQVCLHDWSAREG